MFTCPAGYCVGDTIYFPFDTYSSAGASVTISGLAVTDIEVFKNGSVTQRASDNGYALLDTDGIDFDGRTGLHGFSIDTSDNSDSGFWVDGATYWIHVDAITVDGQTVRLTYWLTLGMVLRPVTAGRKIAVDTSGNASADLVLVDGAAVDPASAQLGVNVVQAGAVAWGSGAITANSIAANAITSAKTDSSFIDEIETAVNNSIEFYDLDHLLKVALPIGLPVEDSFGDVLNVTLADLPTNSELTTALLTNGVKLAPNVAHGGGTASFTLEDLTVTGEFAMNTMVVAAGASMAITGNITGNLSGSVGSVTGAVGSVTGNVGGNVTGSVGSVLGGINTTGGTLTTLDQLDTAQDAKHDATKAVADAIKLKTDNLPAAPAAVGDIPTAIQNADALLNRSITNTQDTADVHSLTTVVLAMLESSMSGTTWTIRKTGGTTFTTKTLAVDAGADPITGVT